MIKMTTIEGERNNDHLVQSDDPEHPANLIPRLCAAFYTLGWVIMPIIVSMFST